MNLCIIYKKNTYLTHHLIWVEFNKFLLSLTINKKIL